MSNYARFTKEVMCYYELPNGIETLDDDCITDYKIVDNNLKIELENNVTHEIKPIWEEDNDYNTSDWDIIDNEGYTEDEEFVEVFNIIQEKKKKTTVLADIRDKYEDRFVEECFEVFGTDITPSHPLYKAFLTYVDMQRDQETDDEESGDEEN